MASRLSRHLLAARPWRSTGGRRLHRALDAAADAALARDRDPGRQPTAAEMGNFAMTYDRERRPRVLLLELEEAVSGKGTTYWRGWAGKARLVGFRNAEPNERGHPTIRIYAEEPEPPRDGPPKAPARLPGRDSGSGRAIEPPGASGPPGAPQRPFRHESEIERRQRVTNAITARCGGGEADP
jgi:hypothetical protein